MANGLKRCKYCGAMVPLDAMKRQRGNTCKSPACERARERDRKADYRARQRIGEEVEAAPEPERPSSGFVAPWGERYESEAEAWADGILTGGLSGKLSEAERERRFRLMSGDDAA